MTTTPDEIFIKKVIRRLVYADESNVNWYFNSKFCHQKATRGLMLHNNLIPNQLDLFWSAVMHYRIRDQYENK